ncbi:MAG: PmoA family protein, partial [Armatimonadota bacterium]
MPVSAEIRAPRKFRALQLTDADSGTKVPCQWERADEPGHVRLLWLLDQLPAGEEKRYRLSFVKRSREQRGTGVALKQVEPGSVEIRIGGQPLGTYRCGQDQPRPYVWPLIGPTGKPITRAYPMEKDVPGETTDHVHHRSFWFAFGAVNGVDFWGEAKHCGRIVHRRFEALESGPVMGRIRTSNDWIGPDGEKIIEDVRELRVYNTTDPRVMDFEITVIASEGPVVLGDTKEGMMAFRVASSMDVKRGGRIENSRGGVNEPQTWGKRAEWCDYSGSVEGETVGIAILDHPDNFRHPTYWMVRNYGLFAANPFGVRIFTGDQTRDGSHTIPAGERLTFKYRIYLHRGNAGDAKIADRWDNYVNPPNVAVTASQGEARGEGGFDPKVPDGYELVFQEDFGPGATDRWEERSGSQWRIEESGEGKAYHLLKGGPPGNVRAPFGYSILEDREVGDFALLVRA